MFGHQGKRPCWRIFAEVALRLLVLLGRWWDEKEHCELERNDVGVASLMRWWIEWKVLYLSVVLSRKSRIKCERKGKRIQAFGAKLFWYLRFAMLWMTKSFAGCTALFRCYILNNQVRCCLNLFLSYSHPVACCCCCTVSSTHSVWLCTLRHIKNNPELTN